jgi:hypothetical protein
VGSALGPGAGNGRARAGTRRRERPGSRWDQAQGTAGLNAEITRGSGSRPSRVFAGRPAAIACQEAGRTFQRSGRRGACVWPRPDVRGSNVKLLRQRLQRAFVTRGTLVKNYTNSHWRSRRRH